MVSLAVQLATKLFDARSRSLLAAVNFSVFANLPNGDCLVAMDQSGNYAGGCIPDFPHGRAIAALVGMEERLATNTAVRLYVGPSLYRPFAAHHEYGVLGRVDIAQTLTGRLSFVVWGEAGRMPINNARSGTPVLFGAGLRVH